MSETAAEIAEKEIIVARVTRQDLDAFPWLPQKLAQKHNKPEAFVKMWLVGMCNAPDVFFVRSENTIAMASIRREPLQPMTVVEEFVLTKKKSRDETACLYNAVIRWAVSLNAERLIVGRITDATLQQIARYTNAEIRLEETAVVHLL